VFFPSAKMVRVLSVYNFSKQDICSIDQIVSGASTYKDVLLIAQSNHRILIKDSKLNVDRTLPTVDQPIAIYYSQRGKKERN